jgi:hypothetical protein
MPDTKQREVAESKFDRLQRRAWTGIDDAS